MDENPQRKNVTKRENLRQSNKRSRKSQRPRNLESPALAMLDSHRMGIKQSLRLGIKTPVHVATLRPSISSVNQEPLAAATLPGPLPHLLLVTITAPIGPATTTSGEDHHEPRRRGRVTAGEAGRAAGKWARLVSGDRLRGCQRNRQTQQLEVAQKWRSEVFFEVFV